MAGELIDGLSEGLRAWVESRAEETDRSPAEVVARAVTVHRLLAEYDGPLPEPSAFEAGRSAAVDDGDGETLAAVDARLDATDERVEAVAAGFDDKLTDVRERVVQVRREADGKADADHDHPEIREAAAGLAADVERVRAEARDLESRVEAGFDNYEDVIGRLSDAVDDLDGKTTTLASVLADVRTRVGEADAGRARREAAADLKREANRLGAGTAACGDCGASVRIALLDAPECPHCGCPYDGVEPSSGWFGFGSATLVAGTPPALTGAAETTAVDPLGTGASE